MDLHEALPDVVPDHAHHYIVERRLARAQELLNQGKLPVKAVASAYGFAEQAHLTRVMRAKLGRTPAELRKSRSH
ncbi:AraC family transcriptional regulator [Pseudacidovorax sp. RU35E]|uniref:helix-turn-helix domain-containing protein n=1 Tax=Pseudacidovorax sp. RU35E TaxID=1907403 RepID=UPI00190ED8E7